MTFQESTMKNFPNYLKSLKMRKKSCTKAKNIVKLVSEFSGDRVQLGILAARTGVKVDVLLDYLLPKEIAERLRY